MQSMNSARHKRLADLTSRRSVAATWQPLAVSLAAALATGSAWADEPSPYYIGITQTLTHDSNVYRVPDATADWYSSTGLVGGVDQRIGRQRVFANLGVQYNKYFDQSNLNNTSYSLAGGWDFATIENFSGGVSIGANQGLASAAETGAQQFQDKNVVKTEQFGARLGWGGQSDLSLNAGYAYNHVSYSAPAFATSEQSSNGVNFGASYAVGPTLSFGTSVRFSRMIAPNGSQVALGVYEENSTDSSGVDLLADWRPTSQTSTNARVGWTRQTNSAVSGRNFSGLTGGLSLNYVPTAKLAFSAGISRDAGSNASVTTYSVSAPAPNANTRPVSTFVTGLSESTQVTNGLNLGARYAATAKVNLNAGVQYRRAQLVDSFTVAGVGGGNERTDDATTYSLGSSYDYSRALSFNCNLAYVKRNVSGNAAYAAFGYSANTASCTAQLTLR